jgi:hypothetical protein
MTKKRHCIDVLTVLAAAVLVTCLAGCRIFDHGTVSQSPVAHPGVSGPSGR